MAALFRRPGGQDHDRLAKDDFVVPTVLSARDDGGNDDITAGQKMLSAMSGSLLTSLLVTPLDVVRVRLQSQNVQQPVIDFAKLQRTTTNLDAFRGRELGVTACCREVFFANNASADYCIATPRIAGGVAASAAPVECAVEEVQQKTISSTFDGLRKIARNEGVTTLWRGLSPTLVMAIPANIIYFTGYDWLRFNAKSPVNRAAVRDEYAPLVAGAAARILAATAVSPVELFRTRLQATAGASTAGGHLTGTFRGIQDMVGSHGYRSLWRGLTLTLWRDVPFSGIYWWGYETIRGRLTDAREARRGRTMDRAVANNSSSAGRNLARRRSQSRENHTDTFVDSFIAGALSGAIASIVTMPFDVGKTRTQVFRDGPADAAKAASAAAAPEEQSMVRLLWHIFRAEGIGGLWKGWIPRTLKVAPACAIMISSYEVGKRTFRSVNARSRREVS